jgi:hypothetical protein
LSCGVGTATESDPSDPGATPAFSSASALTQALPSKVSIASGSGTCGRSADGSTGQWANSTSRPETVQRGGIQSSPGATAPLD